MKKAFFISIIISLLLLNSNKTVASHLLGGEITWECVADGTDKGKYIFLLRLYRACYQGAAGLGPTASISNPLYAQYGGISTIPLTETYSNDLSKPCYDSSKQLQCGIPLSLGGGSAVEEHVYLSLPVKLIGTPDSNGSEFFWTSCCRPALMNLIGASYYLRAIMFPYSNPITNTQRSLGSANAATCFDSSPKFLSKPAIATCANQLITYDHAMFDIDGDSITYNWSIPMQSSTSPTTYKPGYNDTLPLPNYNHDTLNFGPLLDTTTGNIIFNTNTPVGGYHSISIKATSYKDGQKVAVIYRDIVMSIVNCNTTTTVPQVYNYNNPTFLIKEASAINYQSTYTGVYPVGSIINLDLRTEDYDVLPTNPFSSQSVDLEVYGVSMSATPNNNQDCLLKPCAYIDSINPAWNGISFQDSTEIDASFVWNTSCSNLEDFSQYTGVNSIRNFVFQVRSKDNWCPVPGESVSYFSIILVDTNSSSWPLDTVDASLGGANISWPIYSGSNFISYEVYRSYTPAGAWTFLTSISNIQTTSFVDSFAKTDSAKVFYLVEINHGPGCYLGYEVNSIHLKVEENLNSVKLTWNRPYLSASNYINGQYEIWKKDSLGPWTLINTNSFGVETYYDLAITYNKTVEYKVISTDLYNLFAVSNIASIYVDSITPIPGFEEFNGKNVTIYPNPANDILFVDGLGTNDRFQMTVFSIEGKRQFEKSILKGENKLDVSELKAGLYFIQIKNERGGVFQKKFVKS